MRSKLILLSILIALAANCCFPQQDTGMAAPPRIIIRLPDNIAPDAVWIRYDLNRHGSRGERMRLEGNVREYVIFGDPRLTSQPAKIVLYTPGCEFKAYDVDLHPGSEVEERFECDPLPTKTLRGLIPPAEIPSAIYSRLERRLDISGELEADWICDYFLRQQQGSSVMVGGSCLVSPVPLGIVGTLDPANGGKFELAIPDFSRDPAFKRAAEWGTNFGIIEMLLQDRLVGAARGVLWPKDATSGRKGLTIQAEYPETIMFTRSR